MAYWGFINQHSIDGTSSYVTKQAMTCREGTVGSSQTDVDYEDYDCRLGTGLAAGSLEEQNFRECRKAL